MIVNILFGMPKLNLSFRKYQRSCRVVEKRSLKIVTDPLKSQYRSQMLPSMDGLIMKICFSYTKENISVVEKSEIMNFMGYWIGLEITSQSEITKTQKDKGCMLSLI